MVVYVDPPAFPANVKVASAGGLANPYDINANIRTAIMALKDLLDGTESHGADFLFKPGATWDFIVQLGDAVGARKVIIRDSDGVDVAAIDSNGNITMLDSVITGYLDMTEIALPGNPAANALRLFVEDVKGFSFFSFRDENGMVRKIVRDSVFVGKNITGVAIAAMRAVYATGSADGVPTLGLAKADAAATMPAIGVTIETIADGAYGRVMQVGLLEGVNTNAFNAGDVIYVSAATAGGGTATPPTYPNMRQEIGTVLVKGIAGVGVFQCVARSVFNDAVIDHGALLGLGDDDHPQYMTPAEHTAIGDGVPHHAQLHNLLSTSHSDALPAAVLDGDVIIGNVTPAWSKLAISVPAANVRNVFGIDNAELRPSWKTALDAVNPADIAAAAGPGTSLLFSHRDHVHAHPNLGDLHTGYLLATGARAGASAQAQDFGALGIKADLGVESTLNAGMTLEGVLLKDGNIYPSNQVVRYIYDDGSNIVVSTTTPDGGLNLYSIQDGVLGARMALAHLSASPAINDIPGRLSVYAYDDEANLTDWGDVHFSLINIDHSGGAEESRFHIFLRAASLSNEAIIITGAGEIYADVDGTGGAHISTFDDCDDALILRQASVNIKPLLEMGIVKEVPGHRGYMVSIQKFSWLLAGGIYQTRMALDLLGDRITALEARVK